MKLGHANASNVIQSEGVQATSSFNIARTPHMFNILSSGLYSDKIGAVLRELCCNAMDAHIMAGKPELPFQVKLPTKFDRSFYVKDWGPGLDDHEVRVLYTTYGWSSKQQSDEVTGAFGLGSKSPFAYTMDGEDGRDGFTIMAAKDGIKRIYTCHIGEDGGPVISRLWEGPSEPDWPNGVLVTFPVRERDIPEFHTKAVQILRWFKVTPEVLGLTGELKPPKFKFNGSFFHFGPEDDSLGCEPCVLMGNVRYPINAKRLGAVSKPEGALLRCGIYLDLPIGSVLMTPSREELQYTETTKQNLRKALVDAAREVALQIRERVLEKAESTWAWYRKIQDYCITLPHTIQWELKEFLALAGVGSDEASYIAKVVNERSARLPGWVGDGPEGKEHNNVVYGEDSNPVFVDGMALRHTDLRSCRVWYYYRNSAKNSTKSSVRRAEVVHGKANKGLEVRLNYQSETAIYYDDAPAADYRMKELVASGKVDSAVLVTSCRGTPKEFAKEYAEKVAACEQLEGIPVKPVSCLELPTQYLEAQKRRKALRVVPPAELFAEEAVSLLTLDSIREEAKLGELQAGDKFWLVCTDMASLTRARFHNFVNGEPKYQLRGSFALQRVMQSIKVLSEKLGLGVTRVVLVPSEGAARRLKLAEQGFRPLFPWLAEELSKPEALKSLGDALHKKVNVNFSAAGSAESAGLLGVLTHHALLRTPFWSKVKGRLGSAGIIGEAESYAAMAMAEKKAADSSLRNAVETLESYIGLRPQGFNVQQETYWMLCDRVATQIPAVRALNLSYVMSLSKSENPVDQVKALCFVEMALTIDTAASAATDELRFAA